MGRTRAEIQDDKSGAVFRRKSQDLTEIAVEGNQHSVFAGAHLEQRLVARAAEVLVADGHCIVAGSLEEFPAAPADLLVELDLHATRSIGTGTIRSRAASAP